MSLYQRDWYIGKSFIGSAQLEPDPPAIPPCSEVFVCPKCGEVWARTIVQGAAWWPLRARCQRCAPPFFVLQYHESLAIGPGQQLTQTLKTATPGLLNFILKRLLDAAEAQINEQLTSGGSSLDTSPGREGS